MVPKPAPEIDESGFDGASAFEKLTPEEQAEVLAGIDEGLADIEAGRTVSADAVRRWIESLGTDHELSPPECGE